MNDRYEELLKKYEQLCEEIMVRTTPDSGRDARKKYGIQVYSKISMHAISLQKILPYSRYNQDPDEQMLDLASLLVLIRALVEAYYVYFYIMVDDVSADKLDFMLKIWAYHSQSETLLMLEKFNPESSEIEQLKKKVEAAEDKVINNPLFKIPAEFDPKIDNKLYKRMKGIYKKIGKGKAYVLKTKEQLNEAANISENYYASMHKYLSQYVHTTPFSLEQMYTLRHLKNGDPRLFIGLLNYAIVYLAFSIRDFAKSFKLDFDLNVQAIIEESERHVNMFSLDQEEST